MVGEGAGAGERGGALEGIFGQLARIEEEVDGLEARAESYLRALRGR